jgi:hypothetical protein
MIPLFKSSGTIRYGQTNLILDVDQEIVRYYRMLLPKSITINSQMYDAHISVVRKETPPKMEFWGKYAGELVEFEYSHVIRNGEVYYWVDVFSKRLEEIREELGLIVHSPYIVPPEGYNHTFHITLGNLKQLVQQTKLC